MRRDQLAHILRAAARITEDNDILVIGSQSILGSFDEGELPEPAWVSVEADLSNELLSSRQCPRSAVASATGSGP